MAAQMTQTFIKYYINFDFETNRLYHSLSKHGLETPLKSLFYLFVHVYAVFLHGARSMNTLYFSIMSESSNSNVSGFSQSFNHAIYI
jgi:hypothetical protein